MGHNVNWSKRHALQARYGERVKLNKMVDALIDRMGGYVNYLTWYNSLPIGGEAEAIEKKLAELDTEHGR